MRPRWTLLKVPGWGAGGSGGDLDVLMISNFFFLNGFFEKKNKQFFLKILLYFFGREREHKQGEREGPRGGGEAGSLPSREPGCDARLQPGTPGS